MLGQILPFPGASSSVASPIARYLRVGDNHVQLAGLHASGRLPVDRAVFDSSRFKRQRDFAADLRDADVHLVLDTEAAELAALARFEGHARHAPWAWSAPLGPDRFQDTAVDVCGAMARFAVEHGFDTVLAPSHFLGDPRFEGWLEVDRSSCARLRAALDREGGKHIAIDYPVIVPTTMLVDRPRWGEVVTSLSDMPIRNAWLRISGLESEAGPVAIKRYLDAMIACQSSGVPIVADHVGGLTGLATLALGAASGIAGGAGERERFDASQWHNPPPARKDGAFGRKSRVMMPGFQGSLTCEELDVLASARGGRKLCACSDRTCCPHGYEDMLKDSRGHSVRQQARAVSVLEKVPDLKRASHFLSGPLVEAERLLQNLGQLRPSQVVADGKKVDKNKLMDKIQKKSRARALVGAALRHMDEQRGGEWSRSRPIARQQSPGPLFRRGLP